MCRFYIILIIIFIVFSFKATVASKVLNQIKIIVWHFYMNSVLACAQLSFIVSLYSFLMNAFCSFFFFFCFELTHLNMSTGNCSIQKDALDIENRYLQYCSINNKLNQMKHNGNKEIFV